MKLIEAMHNVITNKEDGGVQGCIDLDSILEDLSMDVNLFNYCDFSPQTALEEWFLVPYLDTDTVCGISVLTFHGKPMALITLPSRKSNTTVEWMSEWSASTVKKYLETFMLKGLEEEPTYLGDLYEDFDASFELSFTENLTSSEHKGVFEGKLVEVSHRKPQDRKLITENKNVFVSSKKGVKIPTTIDKVKLLTLVHNNPLEVVSDD